MDPLVDALSAGPKTAGELAERLDVPERDVPERIDDLREAGFEVEREDGEYRVTAVPEYGLGVAYGLDAPFRIEYHESIGSTNDRGRELAAGGDSDVVVLADRQTGGRGREGRSWSSPPGGIYMSVVVRPDLPADRVGLLTLAAAVGTARAIREAGVDAVIKWPNDVQTPGGEKLSGILTESATGEDGVEWAVVGIGVNANVDPEHLPERATSLIAEVGEVERRRIVGDLLAEFDRLRSDPEAILDAWREHAGTLGRRVRVETGEGAIVGEALDVDDSGALRVDTGEGVVAVPAGDCEHLRPAE